MPRPELLTPPQQRFVFAILAGKSQTDAYKEARFARGSPPKNSTASSEASKLVRHPAVANALARAQAQAVDLAAVSTASLVADLQEARQVALTSDPPQTNGAVAATMGIAKLLGLVIDRAQLDVIAHKPAFSSKALELSEDDWRKQFADAPRLTKQAK